MSSLFVLCLQLCAQEEGGATFLTVKPSVGKLRNTLKVIQGGSACCIVASSVNFTTVSRSSHYHLVQNGQRVLERESTAETWAEQGTALNSHCH